MSELTYESLTGLQKAAILMVALGVETASLVARGLKEEEIEDITREMTKLRDIPGPVIDKVVDEFYQMMKAQEYIEQGGPEYAEKLLQEALGPHRASEVLNRVQRSMHIGGFQLLRRADANQILNLIQNEHPQTIALILSFLDASQSAQIIMRLPDDLQREVIYRMATMEKVPTELLNEVEKALEQQIESVETGHAMNEPGGVQVVAEILNMAGKTVEKTILDEIENRDPDLAERIRDLMFTFDDLVYLDDRSIQRVLKEVDTRQMALALKGASEEVKQKIFANMSARAAEMLREELEYMGPVRVRDVEEAQRQIANLVRSLEEEGEIVIVRGGGSEEILV